MFKKNEAMLEVFLNQKESFFKGILNVICNSFSLRNWDLSSFTEKNIRKDINSSKTDFYFSLLRHIRAKIIKKYFIKINTGQNWYLKMILSSNLVRRWLLLLLLHQYRLHYHRLHHYRRLLKKKWWIFSVILSQSRKYIYKGKKISVFQAQLVDMFFRYLIFCYFVDKNRWKNG